MKSYLNTLILAFAVTVSSPFAQAEQLADIVDKAPLQAIQDEITKAPTSVNALNEAGFTPLHIAVISNRPDKTKVVELLIKAGADVNARSIKFGTVIQHAISAGDVDDVVQLINAGADLNFSGADEISSLGRIAWVDDPTKVLQLVDLVKTWAPEQIVTEGSDALGLCVDRINPVFALALLQTGVDPANPEVGNSARAALAERLDSEKDPDTRLTLVTMQRLIGVPDSSFERAIVGTWSRTTGTGADTVELKCFYAKDRAFNFKLTSKGKGGAVDVVGGGSWKVVDGYLRVSVTSSSAQDVVPVGFTSMDKIKNVTVDTLYRRDSKSGLIVADTRVP